MDYLYFVSNISLKKESESFLSSFSIKFNYLKTLNMKVAEENEYLEYSEDINTINRGFSEYAELIDTRLLKNHENQPSRILFTNNFFPFLKAKKLKYFFMSLATISQISGYKRLEIS